MSWTKAFLLFPVQLLKMLEACVEVEMLLFLQEHYVCLLLFSF